VRCLAFQPKDAFIEEFSGLFRLMFAYGSGPFAGLGADLRLKLLLCP
jgi:hypothetical protein